MRASLLGAHQLPGGTRDDVDSLLAARPRIWWLLDEQLDFLSLAYEACDIVGVRIYGFEFDPAQTIEENLARWMTAVQRKATEFDIDLAEYADKLYIQGHNEPHFDNLGDWHAYGKFEGRRAAWEWEEFGCRSASGNFSVGSYGIEIITAFMEGYEPYINYQGALGFHEYGTVWPWAWMGDNQGGEINVDPFPVDWTPAWLVLRYRAALLYDVPVIITEFGLSDVIVDDRLPRKDNGDPYGGWQECLNPWKYAPSPYPDMSMADLLGWDQLTDARLQRDAYMDMIVWADQLYAEDPRVLGVVQYGLGPGHSPGWPKHDISPVVGRQAAYIEMRGDEIPQPPVDPPDYDGCLMPAVWAYRLLRFWIPEALEGLEAWYTSRTGQ